MKRVRGLVLVLLPVVVMIGPTRAGAQGIGVSINPYFGYYHFDESSFEDAFESSNVDSDPIYGIRLGLGGHEGFSVDLSYGRTSVEGELEREGTVLGEDSAIHLFYAALDWHLPLPLVDLFASGGLGAIRYDPDGRDADTNLLVNYGVGVTIPVGRLRVRADVKDHVDFCDAPDDPGDFDFGACLEDEALHNFELSAGVEIPL